MKGYIHDTQTDIISEYEFTKEEIAKRLAARAINQQEQVQAEQLKKEKDEAKKAILSKLGITEEEAKLLLS